MATIFGAISVEQPAFTVLMTAAGYEIRKYAAQIRAEHTWVDAGAGAGGSLNSPFMIIANYIFGKNQAKDKVAMTSPVVTQHSAAAPPAAAAAAAAAAAGAGGAGGGGEAIAMTAPVVSTSSPATPEQSTAQQAGPTGGGTTRTMAFIMPSKYKSISELPAPLASEPGKNVTLREVPEATFAAVRFKGRMISQQEQREAELRAACAQDGVQLSTAPGGVQYCQFNPPWCLPPLRTNEILIPIMGELPPAPPS